MDINQSIEFANISHEKLKIKTFRFNGWNDLLKIQKDKSYDMAIVFVQDCNLKNLPDMSKINNYRLIFFFGGRGAEKEIASFYENYFN